MSLSLIWFVAVLINVMNTTKFMLVINITYGWQYSHFEEGLMEKGV